MNRFRDGMGALTILAGVTVAAPATASPSEISPGVYDYAMRHGQEICRTLRSYDDPQSGYLAARLIVGVGLGGDNDMYNPPPTKLPK